MQIAQEITNNQCETTKQTLHAKRRLNRILEKIAHVHLVGLSSVRRFEVQREKHIGSWAPPRKDHSVIHPRRFAEEDKRIIFLKFYAEKLCSR